LLQRFVNKKVLRSGRRRLFGQSQRARHYREKDRIDFLAVRNLQSREAEEGMRVRFTLALTPARSSRERENRSLVFGGFARALVVAGLWGEDRKAGESKVDHRI